MEMPATPYETLLEIEQACRQYARPVPREHITGRVWQGIAFLSAGYSFVAPLNEISEVVAIPTATPLPESTPWFVGVANLRGRLLPITDLQGFILGTPQITTNLSRVLLIRLEESCSGFLVEEVIGLQQFSENNLSPVSEKTRTEIDPKFIPYLQGNFKEEARIWHVLSLKALSQKIEFYRIIKETEG